ncbi:MAG: histidine kinase dimerization/phospho-acceptor domain-containing protein [Polyangiales bacterium]
MEQKKPYQQLRPIDGVEIDARLVGARQVARELAHRVGTPLNVVDGHANLLEASEDLSPEGLESLRVIREQVQQVATRIQNLMVLLEQDESAEGTRSLALLAENHNRFHDPKFVKALELPESLATRTVDAKVLLVIREMNWLMAALADAGAQFPLTLSYTELGDGDLSRLHMRLTGELARPRSAVVEALEKRSNRALTLPAELPIPAGLALSLAIQDAVLSKLGGHRRFRLAGKRFELEVELPFAEAAAR